MFLEEAITWVAENPNTAMTYITTFIGALTIISRSLDGLTSWKGDNKLTEFLRDIANILSLDSTARKRLKKMGVKLNDDS